MALAEDLLDFHGAMCAAGTVGPVAGSDPRLPGRVRRENFTGITMTRFIVQAGNWTTNSSEGHFSTSLDLRMMSDDVWAVNRTLAMGPYSGSYTIGWLKGAWVDPTPPRKP